MVFFYETSSCVPEKNLLMQVLLKNFFSLRLRILNNCMNNANEFRIAVAYKNTNEDEKQYKI